MWLVLYNNYITKCSKDVDKLGCFYLSPKKQFKVDDKVWFMRSPMGQNTLTNVVRELCNKLIGDLVSKETVC